MKIIILTFHRTNKQTTFHNLCKKLQKLVTFVIRNEESSFFQKNYPKNSILILPDHIKDLVKTKNYILDNVKGMIYILDDDLNFWKRNKRISGENINWKNKSINYNEKEQKKFLHLLQESVQDGYICCGLGLNNTKPSLFRYPFDVNCRLWCNLFLDNRENFKYRYDPQVPASEDLDFILQILSSGCQNKVFYNYFVSEVSYSSGGCSVYRTLSFHNKSNLALEKKWPSVVKSEKRIVKSGPWKGKKKVHVIIQWKKTFKESILPKYTVDR